MGAPSLQDIAWSQLRDPITLTPGVHNVIRVAAEVVPVVFVPGMMGTRLCAEDNTPIWDPDQRLATLWRRWSASPRETWLEQDVASHLVCQRDEQIPDVPLGVVGAQEIVQSAYAKTLDGLVHALQARSRLSQLCFSTPVVAVGYDWIGSPFSAAQSLARRILSLVDAFGQRRVCRRVFLVTHSFGGLIARAALKLFNLGSLCLGVVHAGQPALGAEAMYVHIKHGAAPSYGAKFSLLEQWCLGATPAQSLAMLSRMPSALALLPSENNQERLWLRALGCAHQRACAPMASDIYRDVFLGSDSRFRLIGDAQANADAHLRKNLELAREFRATLGDYSHPYTLHIAGVGLPTYASVCLAPTCGYAPGAPGLHPLAEECPRPSVPQPPDGSGDRTVSERSATYLAERYHQAKLLIPSASHEVLLAHPEAIGAVVSHLEARFAELWHDRAS